MFSRLPIVIDLTIVDLSETFAHIREKCFGDVIVQVAKSHFLRRYHSYPTAIELEEKQSNAVAHLSCQSSSHYLELWYGQIATGSIRSQCITRICPS